MQMKLKLCVVLEIILLQEYIKDLLWKAVNGIASMKIKGKTMFKNVEAFWLEKPTYSPNQGNDGESLFYQEQSKHAEPDVITARP